MSYCRWSSDDFKCDVYAYESEDGYQIHVAARRVVGDVPPLLNILEVDIEAFMESYRKQHEFLETSERKDIGLEYDGMSFSLATLGEFSEKMKELRSKGYNIPDYVFECIADELLELMP